MRFIFNSLTRLRASLADGAASQYQRAAQRGKGGFALGIHQVEILRHDLSHLLQNLQPRIYPFFAPIRSKERIIPPPSSPSAYRTATYLPTATTYSVNADLRFFARFAVSTSSRTVKINSSVVSGVNDVSPSRGHTQAKTFGTRTTIPSSRYSKMVSCHFFLTLCSPHIGAGFLDISLPFDSTPTCRGSLP